MRERIEQGDKQLEKADKQLEKAKEQLEKADEKFLDEQWRGAFTQLGVKNQAAQIAGLRILDELARKHKDKYKEKAFESACDFIRTQLETLSEDSKIHSYISAQKAIDIFLIKDIKDKSYYYKDYSAGLQRANFEQLCLSRAQLQKADLYGANLQRANLHGAQLQGANLSYAQLQGTDLRETKLQRANLFCAKLQRANLHSAQLQRANLHSAQLQEANLRGAQLEETNLSLAQLQGADLREAKLQRAKLTPARLQGARLSHAQLEGTDLNIAELQGVLFNNLKDLQDVGSIKDVDFRGAQLAEELPNGLSIADVFSPYKQIYHFAGRDRETNSNIVEWIRGRGDIESCVTGSYLYQQAMEWIINLTEAVQKYRSVIDSVEIVIDLENWKAKYSALENNKADDKEYQAAMKKLLRIE